MCGRFTLTINQNDLKQDMGLGDFPPDWGERYNVAPSQPVAVVTDPQGRDVELMRWGLVPSWAKDISIGNRLINARAETLTEKPSFRSAFARRRCLILADGFFEWKKPEDRRGSPMPYYFQLAGRKPFAFAGLWEFWRSPEGDPLRSCTIITTQANGLVREVHERMPVMLAPDQMWDWLVKTSQPELADMLKPFPAEKMVAYPISRMVNDPARDVPEVLLPVAEQG